MQIGGNYAVPDPFEYASKGAGPQLDNMAYIVKKLN